MSFSLLVCPLFPILKTDRFFFSASPGRCPLLAIPTAIMYAVEESQGPGSFVLRIAGYVVLLLAFVVASRRLLPLAMARLVLKDKDKDKTKVWALFGK